MHKDVTDRLKRIRPGLHHEVGLIFAQNKQERHIRGVEATKLKHKQIKETASEKTKAKD